MKKIFCFMLALLLGVSVLQFSSPPVTEVEAASYNTVTSSKKGKDGLQDLPSANYYLTGKDLCLHKAKITFIRWSKSTSQWLYEDTDAKSAFSYEADGTDCELKLTPNHGKTDGEWKSFENYKVLLTYPNMVMGTDGVGHDVQLLVHDIRVRMGSSGSGDMNENIKFLSSGGDNLWMWCGGLGLNLEMYVDISITGVSNSDSIYMMFKDIDMSYDGATESVQILSGVKAGTNVIVPSDKELNINDSTHTYSGKGDNTDGADEYKAGFAFLADAAGVKLHWTGPHCGTAIGIDEVDLPGFNVSTQVRYQKGDGSYTSYGQVHSTQYTSGSHSYSYTHTESALASGSGTGAEYKWIFKDPTDRTVSGTHTSSYVYHISYDRNKAVYTFQKNPPSGIDASKITNMPSKQEVYCQNTESGKATITSKLKVPKLENYDFMGWNTKADGSGESYDVYSGQYMKTNKTFYAQWRPKYYYVVYEADDGSGRTWTNGQKYYFGKTYDSITADVANFYRKGYHIWRWRFSPKHEYYYADPEYPVGVDQIQRSFKDLATVSGETVYIKAEWKPNPYIIRIHENYADSGRDYKDFEVTYDQDFLLPAPLWSHPSLCFYYDLVPETKVGGKWRAYDKVRNLTELYDKADDRSKPIIDIYTIWDLKPKVTLSTNEIHYSALKAGSLALDIDNGTVSRSDLEAALMNYATASDYEWDCRYPGTRIQPGTHNGYTFEIASFEPAQIKDSANGGKVDTYYVTFQVTDDAGQTATATLTLFIGNVNVDIMVH